MAAPARPDGGARPYAGPSARRPRAGTREGGGVRHPLSTMVSGCSAEGAVAVGEVGGLVVALPVHQAVPQDLQPAVAKRAQGGVVALAAGALGVVELRRPARQAQAAESPLLDGVGQVAVAGQAGRHDQLALAGAAGDGGLAGVACQRVRRPELLGMVADLAGDPGGEAVTKPWEAEVDLAARDRLPRLVLLWLAGAAVSGRAQQQLAHTPLPGPPLGADGQQLDGGQADGVGLGADQVVAWGEVVAGQRLGDLVGQAFGPAVVAGPGEGPQLGSGGVRERLVGWPALQQPQHGRGAQVVAGDDQRGRERGDEVLAQPVEQAALVAGGAVVVAGDRAQFPGQLAVGDERAQARVAVQGQQAGQAGVGGVVLLAGGAAAAGEQVRVTGQGYRPAP